MEPLLQILTSSLSMLDSTPLGRLTAWIEAVAEYLDRAEERTRILRILWFIATICVIVLTAIVAFLLWWLWSWKVAAFASVVLWAIFFGATGLLFLPPKAMTAIFGTVIGISLSEVSSGAGLLTAANKAVSDISRQIGAIITPSTGGTDPFIAVLVWTFVLVMLLVSLPAFFATDKAVVAEPSHNAKTDSPQGA